MCMFQQILNVDNKSHFRIYLFFYMSMLNMNADNEIVFKIVSTFSHISHFSILNIYRISHVIFVFHVQTQCETRMWSTTCSPNCRNILQNIFILQIVFIWTTQMHFWAFYVLMNYIRKIFFKHLFTWFERKLIEIIFYTHYPTL